MKHAANPVRPAALTDWLTMRQDTIRRTFYVTLACLAFLAAIGPTAFEIRLILAGVAGVIAALLLLRRQRLVEASGLMLGVILLIIAMAAFQASDGLRSITALCFPTLVVLAALLLPFRWFLVYAAAVVLVVAGVGFWDLYLASQGVTRPRTPVSIKNILTAEVYITVGAIVAAFIARNLDAGMRTLNEALLSLSESEQRFRSLSDAALEGILIHNRGVIVDANAAFVQLFGYDHISELKGRLGYEFLMAEECRDLVIDRTHNDDSQGRVEVRGIRRDGTSIFLETESRPIRFMGQQVKLVSLRDITQRRTAEQERELLAAEQRRMEETMDNVARGVSPKIGTEFFRDMVVHLANALKADCALVGRLAEPGGSRIITEALFSNNEIIDNMEYDLRGTPCYDVFESGACCLPADVQRLFPSDALLAQMDAQAYAGIPLQVSDGTVVGILVVLSKQPFEHPSRVITTLSIFGSRAAAEIDRVSRERELVAAREDLRALAARLDNAQEQERRRVAREIHDELGQQLTALHFELHRLRKQPDSDYAALTSALQMVDASIQSVRNVARQLWPAVLEKLGLAAAIEWQASEVEARTGMPVICEVLEEFQAPLNVNAVAFRILQEALTNAIRHSGATHVNVRLERTAFGFELQVRDNGKGISQQGRTFTNSLGVLGMKERALAAGGMLEISGQPGRGTCVTARLPVTTAAPPVLPC